MMKVLIGIIIDGHSGGIDQYLLNFFRTVKSEGLHFDFLTNKIDPELKAALEKEDAGLIEIPRATNPAKQCRAVREIAEKSSYDAAYFNISTALMYGMVKGAKQGGIKKVIVHSHSSAADEQSPLKARLTTFLNGICRHKLCRYATDFCSCSDKASKWLFTKKILKSGKIKKIYNAVDADAFRFDPETRQKMRGEMNLSDNFVIIHVGNFLDAKNHRFLIDAFAETAKAKASAKLILVGSGELLGEIKSKASALGLADKIIFTGYRNDVPALLNASDVFVLPSKFEGLPTVAVEAQINGLPCILSDRISRETRITDRCEFADISSKEEWAEKILAADGIDRTSAKIVNTDYIYDSKKMKNVFLDILNIDK